MNEITASPLRYGPAKRLFDVTLALPGLLLAAPVVLVAMAMIRATSEGPAIFAQERIGREEQRFRCYKLRTMYVNTPHVATHEVAASAITPVGRFLRRFKIDELPQLWNVVTGQMSLVGPRPCLPAQDDLIRHRRALGVFSLMPGITGLAQVRGIDMSNPLRCAQTDAEYMRSISLSEDLRLIVRTVL